MPAAWQPAYVALNQSGELRRRAAAATELLAPCRLCPRQCRAARLANQTGFCRLGRAAVVASYGPHHGEEDCLRGWSGSGSVFFAGCNLGCVFCQNWDISHTPAGRAASAESLAAIMLELQARGCHNINWVTPTHVVPQLLEALTLAANQGLRLPIVYNTGGYDAVPTLRLLDGVVDVYMPDFKFWQPDVAARLADAPDYPEVARRAIREMHRQVGDLTFDDQGLAQRGLLVRHLVLPNDLADTRSVAQWLASHVSPDTYINVMAQYHPDGAATDDPAPAELRRTLTTQEFRRACADARSAGLRRFDQRYATYS
ncbi:MAG: radical SAM protein [Verrucomicrobia bacterium]|nr:radical SAM protein [Verrucomicrobiota bacterium]